MPKRLAAPAAPRREGHERRIDALLIDRDRLMSALALRARLGNLPPMRVKARTLLTRFWGKSSWEARSEILGVARLLMTLGAAQPALRAHAPPPRSAASASWGLSADGKRAKRPARLSG